MLQPAELTKLKRLLTKQDDRLPIVFAALSDAHRCAMFRSIIQHKELCVSDIAHALGISMSLASQHLKILEITKLVFRERKGRSVYFHPNTQDHLVSSIIKAIT